MRSLYRRGWHSVASVVLLFEVVACAVMAVVFALGIYSTDDVLNAYAQNLFADQLVYVNCATTMLIALHYRGRRQDANLGTDSTVAVQNSQRRKYYAVGIVFFTIVPILTLQVTGNWVGADPTLSGLGVDRDRAPAIVGAAV